MAYKKTDLIEKSLDVINKHKLLFIEDVVAYLPCDKKTFYNHKLHEFPPIKEALETQKVNMKVGIRQKLYNDTSATGLIALYKLLGTEEEVHRLNGSNQKIDHTTNGKEIVNAVDPLEPCQLQIQVISYKDVQPSTFEEITNDTSML